MVRWLLIQAALSHTRVSKGPSRRHYLGVRNRQGKKIARVAAARKLLGVMFHLMKDEIDYEEFVRRGSSAQRDRRFKGNTEVDSKDARQILLNIA